MSIVTDSFHLNSAVVLGWAKPERDQGAYNASGKPRVRRSPRRCTIRRTRDEVDFWNGQPHA